MIGVIENERGWRGRLWGWAGENLRRYGGMGEEGAPSLPVENMEIGAERASEYAVRWAYAENKRLYHKLHAWGVMKQPMATAWNPIPAVVEFYEKNVLFGKLEILPEQRPTADGSETSATESDGLVAAVGRVHEWSNFAMLKQELVRTGAVGSDVLVKVATRTARPSARSGPLSSTPSQGEGEQVASVYLQRLPLRSVRYCRVDERGIVQEVRLDTPRLTSLFGTADREHIHVEIWRKSWDGDEGGVRFYEVEGRQAVEDKNLPAPVHTQTFSELGYDFVPVVWTRCKTPWWELTDQIDYYNVLAAKSFRLNVPLGMVRANSVDSEGRPMPAPAVERGQMQATYQEVGNGAAAILRLPGRTEFEWSNGPIDFAALHRDMEMVREAVELSLPEYRVAKIDARAAIAADTLEILLKQATQRVLDVRWSLEAALVRAQMMALTLGQLAKLEGFSEQEIGRYDKGDFGHTFAERDVFEPSVMAMASALKELVAAQMPTKLALGLAGFGQAVVEAYDAAAAEQVQRERVTLAGALVRARQEVDSGSDDNGATRI